jgi:hypothetical protein
MRRVRLRHASQAEPEEISASHLVDHQVDGEGKQVNEQADNLPPKKEDSMKTPETGKELRLCACGCGEQTKSNRSPFIKGHNPKTKKKVSPSAGKKRKTRRVSPPRKNNAKAIQPANGVATICVTEAHLDSFWMKLSLEEKAQIFTRQLEGA